MGSRGDSSLGSRRLGRLCVGHDIGNFLQRGGIDELNGCTRVWRLCQIHMERRTACGSHEARSLGLASLLRLLWLKLLHPRLQRGG